MNIAQIRELDIGMAGISCSGQISWAGKPRHVVSEPEDPRDYDFWSQFIVLKDPTEKIGVDITSNSELALAKDQAIVIEKSTLGSYKDKNGDVCIKLTKAQLKPIPTIPTMADDLPQQPAGRPAGSSEAEPASTEQLSITTQSIDATSSNRQCAVTAAADYCGKTGKNADKIVPIAIELAFFIKTGKNFTNIPKPDASITETGKKYIGQEPTQGDEIDF